MEFRLSQLIDTAKVRMLTDLVYGATGISASVTDPDGTIVADSGWHEVCRGFHHVSPDTRARCRRGDGTITFGNKDGTPHVVERCGNGLVDAVVPITVLGSHVGDFVAGQFLLNPPDMEFFKAQALKSGFDESAYLGAVAKLPVVDEKKLSAFLQSFSIVNGIVGEAGLRKMMGEAERLAEAEMNLDAQSRTLEEVNTALRVLLKQRAQDKADMEGDIVSNIRTLVVPYLEELRRSGLSPRQAGAVDTIGDNLGKITSPVLSKMKTLGLTATEIAVASYVKDGKTTDEIAALLGVSLRAVEFHRYNIRKKLGLGHTRTNLRSYLLLIE